MKIINLRQECGGTQIPFWFLTKGTTHTQAGVEQVGTQLFISNRVHVL